jgi:N-acetylmuramoyl-L-alanine amidase
MVLVIALMSVAASSSAALEMDLMQGETRRGTISFVERDGAKFAALDEAFRRLGLAASYVEGGFVVTYSGKKIEFWSGSNIARVNGTVYAMPNMVFSEDGHWWGEAESSLVAINQFQLSAGRPSNLSWAQPSSGVRTVLPQNAPVAPSMSPRPSAPEAPAVKPPADSAVIGGVRWGDQAVAYRAVMDISKQVDASLQEYPDRVEVTFRGSTVQPFSLNSPWPPLAAVSRQSGNDVVITFNRGPGKVKGFWLMDPPRYVVDFYSTGTLAPPGASTRPAGSGTIGTRPETPSGGAGEKYLVVVDAGHGGQDPGASGNKLVEKDINLRAAKELAESLKALGMDVKLTRNDDRYLTLTERPAFAIENNADVFISLHCNALPKGRHASGTEMYLMDEPTDRTSLNLAIMENRELSGDAHNAAEINAAADKRTKLLLKILGDMQQNDKINQSITLAEYIYDRMRGDGFPIRKVLQAPFAVLRGAGMPALLVEMGYITEASDAKRLASQSDRKKMMDSLARGISNYLKNGMGEGGI